MALVQYLLAGMQHMFQPLLVNQTRSFVVAESPGQHDPKQKLWSCTTRVRAIVISHLVPAGVRTVGNGKR